MNTANSATVADDYMGVAISDDLQTKKLEKKEKKSKKFRVLDEQ